MVAMPTHLDSDLLHLHAALLLKGEHEIVQLPAQKHSIVWVGKGLEESNHQPSTI